LVLKKKGKDISNQIKKLYSTGGGAWDISKKVKRKTFPEKSGAVKSIEERQLPQVDKKAADSKATMSAEKNQIVMAGKKEGEKASKLGGDKRISPHTVISCHGGLLGNGVKKPRNLVRQVSEGGTSPT